MMTNLAQLGHLTLIFYFPDQSECLHLSEEQHCSARFSLTRQYEVQPNNNCYYKDLFLGQDIFSFIMIIIIFHLTPTYDVPHVTIIHFLPMQIYPTIVKDSPHFLQGS